MQVFYWNIVKFVIYFGINVPSLRKAIFLTNCPVYASFLFEKSKIHHLFREQCALASGELFLLGLMLG
jgi:hypothetical protein